MHVYSADLGTSYPDITTGAGAFGLAIDRRAASHRLFVARYPGTVEVYSLPAGTLLCAYGAGGTGLNAVAFDPGSEKLFVPVEVSPKVAVSAGAGNCSITSSVATHDKPLDIAIDQSANRVYAPIQTNLTVGDAPASVEADPELDTAYVGSRNFSQLRPVTHDVVQSPIALGFEPGKPAVHPTTHCVYVPGTLGAARKLARLCHSFSSVIAEGSPVSWFGLGEGSGTTMTNSAGGPSGYYQNGSCSASRARSRAAAPPPCSTGRARTPTSTESPPRRRPTRWRYG